MQTILQIKSLEKHFGSCRALQGVDMTVAAGQIMGLLGPNASGKTTLFKTIAGLLQPSAGSIQYGINTGPGPEARKTISFCPDLMAFPNWMRVNDAFTFYREMYDDYSQDRALTVMGILELLDIQKIQINRLSKGMKERLNLGLCLSRETNLYMLDEPLDGIDPVGKTLVIDAILAMKPEIASVLISTHLVKDIERILDSVSFLSKGRIVFSNSCDSMREEKGLTVEQAYLEVFSRESSM